jgi:hypothetical protein
MVRPTCAAFACPDKSLTARASILTKFCHPRQALIGHRELAGGGVGQCLDIVAVSSEQVVDYSCGIPFTEPHYDWQLHCSRRVIMGYLSPGGGIAASVRFGADQMCVFSVDETGALNVYWVASNGPWQGPMKISQPGLTIPGAQLAASRQFGADQTDVFLFDTHGQLNMFSAQATLGWSGPQTIGGANVAKPGAFLAACAQANGNQTDVFFVDINGRMNVASVKGDNPWGSPQTIGPSGLAPSGAPVAAIQQAGTQRTSVFVVDNSGQLNGFWVDGSGAWSGPHKIGPANLVGPPGPGASIAVCQQVGSTVTDVFLFDVNLQLNRFWQDSTNLSGGWQGPQKIGQAGFSFSAGSPLVATQQFGTQQTDVVAADQFGQLWVFSDWNGLPEKIGGSAIVHGAIASAQQASADRTDVVSVDLSGQLNIFWVDGNGAWQGPLIIEDPVPGPPGGYRSSADYILASGQSCANLTSIKATIYITEDLVWQSSQNGNPKIHPTPGFSIQLNAETNKTYTIDWLQFVVQGHTTLNPWMNIWSPSDLGSGWGQYNGQWVWESSNAAMTHPLPTVGKIPKGWTIIIELVNDSEGRITGANWSVLDENNNSKGSAQQQLSTQASSDPGGVPPADLCPVASFQVTFGGDVNGDHATFSSGAGLIILQADQKMTPDTAYPPCIGYIDGTGETSNIGYGELSATPSTMFSQPFYVLPEDPSMHTAKPDARRLPPKGTPH